MPEIVVDPPKAVQVDKENRHRVVFCSVYGVFQTLQKKRAVGQPGQGVVKRKVIEARRAPLALACESAQQDT